MKKVVVADDSNTARMFIIRCFEIAGFAADGFVQVKNGKEALDILQKEQVDLLVTDLSMPVMDGVELLKRISADPELNDIPVIVITSASNPAREKELKDFGAKYILNKPISPPDVMEALEELCLLEDE